MPSKTASLFIAAIAIASPAAAADLDAAFEIVRKGDVIGYHLVDVEPTADGYEVKTEIAMKVKFGPVPVFRYRHDAREVWRGGQVQSIESTTDDNGKELFVNARREAGGLAVEGTAFEGVAPEGAIPSSYWNKAIIETTTLLNTQTGALIDVVVSALGETTAPHAALAEHYELKGSVGLNLWYDGDKWVGATFEVRGQELTYRLVADETARTKLAALTK